MSELQEQIELMRFIGDKADEYAKEQIKYQHRGMSRRGVDCTGLLIAVIREYGYMKKYRLRKYPPDWNVHGGAGDYVREGLKEVANPINVSTPSRGDVVLFRFGKCVAHAGIVSRFPVMVHCHRNAGRCQFGVLVGSEWGSRWVETWRVDWDKVRRLP